MKSTTLAWWFSTSTPLPLKEACKRLGRRWFEHDSDCKRDSISGPLTQSARARIFKFGPRGFLVNLTVEVERDTDLEAMVAEAKEKLFRDVLPLLGAQEISESTPEEY